MFYHGFQGVRKRLGFTLNSSDNETLKRKNTQTLTHKQTKTSSLVCRDVSVNFTIKSQLYKAEILFLFNIEFLTRLSICSEHKESSQHVNKSNSFRTWWTLWGTPKAAQLKMLQHKYSENVLSLLYSTLFHHCLQSTWN